MKAGPPPSTRGALLLAAAGIVLATLVAYAPAMLHGGFVWDDDLYVTNNRLLVEPGGLARLWFSSQAPSQYFPLVYTTFWLEQKLWGLDPTGFHVVNVLLHIANSLLVWRLLRRLSVPGSWLAAAIFALHPVQVESVAWITERKNVLSTLFYLLALSAWMTFAAKRDGEGRRSYVAALGLYWLALLSKTTACTLPAAMLLVLWLQGERPARRRWGQVAPFAGLGLAMGLFTVWWERFHQGTAGPEFAFTIPERVLIASRALWFYLGKLLWPSPLVFSYAKWPLDPGDWRQYAWLLACAAVVVALWRWTRSGARGPAAAALFFAATLSPLLGFLSLYTFRFSFVADHYQYVACIGPIALFAAAGAKGLAAAGRIVGRPAARSALAVVVSGFVLCALGGLTWRQARLYENLETLWTHTLEHNPSSWMARGNLGVVYYGRGELDRAITAFQDALHLNPEYADAWYNLAVAFNDQGKTGEAAACCRNALRFAPKMAWAHNNLGLLLQQQGQLDEAIDQLRQAAQLAPDTPEIRQNLEQLQQLKQGQAPPAPKTH